MVTLPDREHFTNYCWVESGKIRFKGGLFGSGLQWTDDCDGYFYIENWRGGMAWQQAERDELSSGGYVK